MHFVTSACEAATPSSQAGPQFQVRPDCPSLTSQPSSMAFTWRIIWGLLLGFFLATSGAERRPARKVGWANLPAIIHPILLESGTS